MESTKTVAKINNVNILLIENGEKLVPIRPICDALGIDYKSQYDKIKSDDALGIAMVLSPAVGADKKEREMVCIPYMYVFGWLFTINPKNVKPEAKDAVARYRIECYKALYKHFTDKSDFLEQKQSALESQINEVDRIRADFKNTKQRLDEARRVLNQLKEMTFDQWQANNQQLAIDFPEADVYVEDDDRV